VTAGCPAPAGRSAPQARRRRDMRARGHSRDGSAARSALGAPYLSVVPRLETDTRAGRRRETAHARRDSRQRRSAPSGSSSRADGGASPARTAAPRRRMRATWPDRHSRPARPPSPAREHRLLAGDGTRQRRSDPHQRLHVRWSQSPSKGLCAGARVASRPGLVPHGALTLQQPANTVAA